MKKWFLVTTPFWRLETEVVALDMSPNNGWYFLTRWSFIWIIEILSKEEKGKKDRKLEYAFRKQFGFITYADLANKVIYRKYFCCCKCLTKNPNVINLRVSSTNVTYANITKWALNSIGTWHCRWRFGKSAI